MTNHKAIHQYDREHTPENTPEMQIEYAKGTWEIIECNGCEEVSFREIWVTSEDFDQETGMPYEHVRFYPEHQENDLKSQQFDMLPKKVREIYSEAIKTFNKNLYFSSTACLRAIIEGVCSNLGIKERNIEKQIDKLFEMGFLTKQHTEVLHQHRLIGNKALHELQIPTREELVIAIKIIEHTLENIYELQEKFEELKFLRENRVKKQ